MNLESQVCSLELAKRLKELGVKQESLFYWIIDAIGTRYDLQTGSNSFWSAFTVAELGEMLPYYHYSLVISLRFFDFYLDHPTKGALIFKETTEVNARAKMLIYLIENGLMELPNA